MLERVRTAWRDAGRQDQPRLAALVYFSLGEEVDAHSRAYLRHYYRFLGENAEMFAEGAVRTDTSIRDTVAQFKAVGVTELYFVPTVALLEQIDRLADGELLFGTDRSVNQGRRTPRPILRGQCRRGFQRTSIGGQQGPRLCTAVRRTRSRSAP